MTENDKQLIETMEAKYDAFNPKLEALRKAVEDFQNHYDDYIALKDFYGSDDWHRLYDQPHDDVKCGVLSQDQLFNLVTDHNDLLKNVLELAPSMYKNM